MAFFSFFVFWAWLGVFNLCVLTWQDYKNRMSVDDRKNHFMLGVSFFLLSHVSRGFFYIIGLIVFLGVFNWFMGRIRGFGSGDVSALTWIFLGFGILSPFFALYFWVVFALCTLFYQFVKSVVFRFSGPIPFFGVILVSFLLSVWWCGVLF